MLLAGDIGGTKTILALYSLDAGPHKGPLHRQLFASEHYASLEEILMAFFRETGEIRPVMASFGVAGPIEESRGNRAQVTNLPWSIDTDRLRHLIPQILLNNDQAAFALAIPHLTGDDLVTLNHGDPSPTGNKAVIAPGTGLGVAFLVWTGDEYKVCASEGGHIAFSSQTPQQIELCNYLQRRYGHVSFERVCSGRYLPGIYDFFVEACGLSEPAWLKKELAAAKDRTPIIVETGLACKAEICETTLDMFVLSLGTFISNMAVTLLPFGGIYLGGGIPPRIIDRLRRPDFLGSITNKGRFQGICQKMPVHIVTRPDTALFGAACAGFNALSKPDIAAKN
ncbi:MAG: glucokinase [Desulfobulbus propionicus]|nr:MAG: glucokinase [Desulfobulbus propionicus]